MAEKRKRMIKDRPVLVRVEAERVEAILNHYRSHPKIELAPLFYKWIAEGMKRDGIKFNGG